MQIQCFSGRQKVYAKGNASRGASRFCPVPYFEQHIYISDAPQTPGVYLALFADDTCLYATDRKEGFVVRNLQRGLSSMEISCERWNIKINEEKSQGIYYSRSCLQP
jgi:hypothetical protein